MHLSLVVLAAGVGSRYGGLKQMDPIGPSGEFIIDYSVYDGISAGFDKVVFVIRKDIEKEFKATIGERVGRAVATEFVYQELSDLPDGYSIPADRKKPWGTSHAILAAADAVDGPFAVVNGDDFYGRESYEVLARFLEKTSKKELKYSMVGFVLRNTLSDHGSVTRAICSADAGSSLTNIAELSEIAEKNGEIVCPSRTLSGSELVSMNMWGFKPAIFPQLHNKFKHFLDTSGDDPTGEYLIPVTVGNLVAERECSVTVLETQSAWFGVTNPADKAVAVSRTEELIKAGIYPDNLWA